MSTVSHVVPTREPLVPSVPVVDLDTHGREPAMVRDAVARTRKRADDLAFEAALDAIANAMKVAVDRDGMWCALRTAVNLYAGRDACTGEKFVAEVEEHLETALAEYAGCPRCTNKMDLPGRSRATPDREIEICGPCCSDETLREAAGRSWPAVSEWPMTRA